MERVNEALASGSPRVLSSSDEVLRIRQGGVCRIGRLGHSSSSFLPAQSLFSAFFPHVGAVLGKQAGG